MISVTDTAYPRFKSQLSQRELENCYTPTALELDYCQQYTRGDEQRLGFLVSLKAFQRLGYFVRTADVPDVVIDHIAKRLGEKEPRTTLNRYDVSRARRIHFQLIRDYLQVKPFASGGDAVLQRALREAALTKEDLADITNAGLETLIRFRYELPAFSRIVRMAHTQRAATYRELFSAVYER